MMKNFPLGIYTFKNIIQDNYLYIDKTEQLYNLLAQGQAVYFLSRPRRFGKSLTLSTLKAIFEGHRELFKGLAIYKKPYDWKTYPVIYLNFAAKKGGDVAAVEQMLIYAIDDNAEKFNIKLERIGAEARFAELVKKLGQDEKVVILIDEYDKPILDNIEDINECQKILQLLKSFYGVIKVSDEYLRFAMLTGVSKFSKVSVFSDLNNLYDLTMDAKFSTAVGITQTELESNFTEYITQLATAESMSHHEILAEIKSWYNGYRFSDSELTVYNPVSLMNLFHTNRFKNYWFETGTPTFLLNLIKNNNYDVEKMPQEFISEYEFSTYEIDNLSVPALLFQTGYLTIVECRKEFRNTTYRLDYPNFEVAESFNQRLLNAYSSAEMQLTTNHLNRLANSLLNNDLEQFFSTIRVFFKNVPYDIQLKHEKYYQTIFYIIFTLLGLRIEAEVKTDNGRIDAVAWTEKYRYIFEFKFHDSAETALEQIKTKKYYEKYLTDNRVLIIVGATFDQQTRNIEHYISENIPQIMR